jgi:glycosyltransferase involved in cell wall biosynthesis
MIRVTALTSGRNVPSSRFRVRQFIRPLAEHGVLVSERWPIVSKYVPSPKWARGIVDPVKIATRLPGLLAARSSDVTWLQRELVPRRRSVEDRAGRTRILDVDDAIWLTSPIAFSEAIAADCYGVIAGNQFIADHYRPVARRVWIVPTSIDTDAWKPCPAAAGGRWTVGWTGSSSNLPYLLDLDEPLAEFLNRHPQADLLVVCDRRPRLKHVPSRQLRFVPWSPAAERSTVQQMHAGLMPLPPTEWARGKCAFKMLQYMAVAIPVIASPVGVNDMLLRAAPIGLPASSPADWSKALERLIGDARFAAEAGAAGRKLVEEQYSVGRSAVVLAQIFKEAAAWRGGE